MTSAAHPDEQNISPDQAEAAVDEAAAAQEPEEQLDEMPTEADAEPDLEAQLAERTEDLQRLSAEYTNYRRRTERERETIIQGAKASVLKELLPIMDDLKLAEQHGDLDEGPLKSFADKLGNVLSSQNLTAFGVEGEAFDPEIHEAVQDLSEGEEKVLGTVLRQGYRVGERVIRTAMVIIADPNEQPDQDS